jgi:AAA+ ATPase superfamily predicted ATPase
MPFFNRIDELSALERRWASDHAEYMVVYGRRRVGKTELILRFAEGKRTLYFEATSGTEYDHLEDVSNLMAETTGRELFAAQPLTTWPAFFAAVAEELEGGPLLIALDEFQFVARAAADIGSYINRFWRAHKENPNLFLIVSGSDISFFEKELMGYSATTYGRRTGSIRLQPFPFGELTHFLSKWTVADTVRAYAVAGGTPYYLEAFDPGDSLHDNIVRVVLAPDGLLREEPRFLFSQHTDLRDGGVYFSILRAVAAGRTRRNEIAARIQRSDDATGKLLDKLIDMGLVHRVHPVTVLNPERTKTVRFAIDDPFLRFWFHFVLPFEGRLRTASDARRHLSHRIAPELDEFVSEPVFEQICQQWLRREVDAAAAGWWWGSVKERTPDGPRNVSREVDAVAIDDDGAVLALGSCKWTDGALPLNQKTLLERLVPHVRRAGESPDLFFFSRSGFAQELVAEAERDPRLHLVGAEELIDPDASIM